MTIRHKTTFEEYRNRFWERVDKSGDCWVWTSTKAHWGYGRFTAKSLITQMGYQERLAHRWAWIFEKGPIPKGMVVRHSCDNPPCVNIAHLSLGTQADNIRDRDERNRRRPGFNRGELNGKAVLTEAQVREIRGIYVSGSRTHGTHALARQFNVNQMTISLIVRRKTWKDLV